MQQVIAALPPQRRLVFSLSKIEGKSYEEISTIMGISRSTINDHMVKSVKNHFLDAGEITLVIIVAAWLQNGK